MNEGENNQNNIIIGENNWNHAIIQDAQGGSPETCGIDDDAFYTFCKEQVCGIDCKDDEWIDVCTDDYQYFKVFCDSGCDPEGCDPEDEECLAFHSEACAAFCNPCGGSGDTHARSPTSSPTASPTPSPTAAQCMLDTSLHCAAFINNELTACEAIPEETDMDCNCPECVRELQFKYTGLACSPDLPGDGLCTDSGPNPFIAGYRITSFIDPSQVFATGQVQQNDFITIGQWSGCLPDELAVTISVPTGAVTQTFQIDSTCNGGSGLLLNQNYGAFESVGYSCSETDTHNCFQEFFVGESVCNTGSGSENIYSLTLELTSSEGSPPIVLDLSSFLTPEDKMLEAGECREGSWNNDDVKLNRCKSVSYSGKITASATNPDTGLPPSCTAENEIEFGWESTPAPTETD